MALRFGTTRLPSPLRQGQLALATRCTFCSPSLRLLRSVSTLTRVKAAADAEREAPTPLLFLSTAKISGRIEDWSRWTEFFKDRGWESLVLELDPPRDASQKSTGDQVLEVLEKDMVQILRSAPGGMPFPPTLISTGWLGGLVAQAYASSHSLSALVLVDPAISSLAAHEEHRDLLPSAPDEPNFEPRFPLRIAWTRDEVNRLGYGSIEELPEHRIEAELAEEDDFERTMWEEFYQDGTVDTLAWLEDEVGLANDHSDAEVIPEAQEDASNSEDADGPPAWFVNGSYAFNPTGSKKMPLLLDPKDLRETFVRGSGPGGQAINKLSTCVDLRHLPTGRRIVCQETRERTKNREIAHRRMSVALEHLVRGGRGSVKDQKLAKAQKRKRNKAKKQRRRLRASDAAASRSGGSE